MDFRYVHIYSHPAIDAKSVANRISELFPKCKIDIRKPFRYDDRIEYSRISDLKQPFEKQPKQTDANMPLYDGFVLQRVFAEMIPTKETDHVHMIVTDLLTCTFSDDDWRYHGRTVVCGTPSIISTTGIVEAPAKPKEFYLAQLGGMADIGKLKKQFAGRFIDHDDHRVIDATVIYSVQALFFFVSNGEPFCTDKSCLLYNAHWQEELVHLVEKGTFCANHKKMANKFNKEMGRC